MPRQPRKYPLTVIILLIVALAATIFFLTRHEEETVPEGTPLTAPALNPPVASGPPAGMEEANATSAKPARPVEDKVITSAFAEGLADYLVSHYHPAGSGGDPQSPATSTASFKGASQTWGQGLQGLNFQSRDLGQARREIFTYIMGPGMIHGLYDLYVGYFLEVLEERAQSAEKTFSLPDSKTEQRPLSAAQTAEMLRLNAPKIQAMAATLRAIAGRPQVLKELGRYHEAARRAQEANDRFQDLMSRANPADKDVMRLGTALKNAIAAREQIKSGLLDQVRADCGRHCQDDADILYFLLWSARRLQGHADQAPALAAMGEVLEDLSARFLSEAGRLEALPQSGG